MSSQGYTCGGYRGSRTGNLESPIWQGLAPSSLILNGQCHHEVPCQDHTRSWCRLRLYPTPHSPAHTSDADCLGNKFPQKEKNAPSSKRAKRSLTRVLQAARRRLVVSGSMACFARHLAPITSPPVYSRLTRSPPPPPAAWLRAAARKAAGHIKSRQVASHLTAEDGDGGLILAHGTLSIRASVCLPRKTVEQKRTG